MARPSSYPLELRQRAVRMVAEFKSEYGSEFEAIKVVAVRLGIGSPETLRKWVRRAEIDAGQRPGVTTEESQKIKELRKENAELRRANEILKAAAAFFGAELDRPHR
ncbi:MAG: transposase [Streptosporangiales bacterium]